MHSNSHTLTSRVAVKVILYRSFLNTDIPHLADIWRSHPPMRGFLQGVTPTLLERYVYSKPYFDQHGLIVATEEDRCIGFAHAGFGPSDDLASTSPRQGAISAVRVLQREDRFDVGTKLRTRADTDLRDAGCHRIVAGGQFPVIPFYLGLYGGCRMPGILKEDEVSLEHFRQSGFEEVGRQSIMHCSLTKFRPTVNRQQMANRRTHQVMAAFDPSAESWWEACTLGWAERVRFTLQEKNARTPCGQVMFWDMEPLSSQWGVRSMGLYDLGIDIDKRRCGRATYLVGEALRQLASQSVALVEVQVNPREVGVAELFNKLGFEEVDEGILLEKK
ncbi:MAG: GNAT family N-acetyltransferase [Planctomycetota bacterium]|nr:GNAT family N-acetyltransferase [Planctomycetota bacterium]